MSGTKAGSMKAAATIKKRYGKDFYSRIGAKGSKLSRTGGFASTKVGTDGLTGPERARIVGAEGGRNGSRLGIKSKKRPDSKPVVHVWEGNEIKVIKEEE